MLADRSSPVVATRTLRGELRFEVAKMHLLHCLAISPIALSASDCSFEAPLRVTSEAPLENSAPWRSIDRLAGTSQAFPSLGRKLPVQIRVVANPAVVAMAWMPHRLG